MIKIIITFVLTLVSVYIGYLLSGRTAKKTVKFQEFNKAASEFHVAFIEAQRRLDESKSFDIIKPKGIGVKTILTDFITEHERAFIKFRPYISKYNLTSFDKAWETYYSYKNGECLSGYQSKEHESSSLIDSEHEDKIRKLALLRIENLLKFTELK